MGVSPCPPLEGKVEGACSFPRNIGKQLFVAFP